jgi:hypothetical protein
MTGRMTEVEVVVSEERVAFSRLLGEFVAAGATPEVSIGELIDATRDRAFGAVLLVFAAPNMLPVTPPGFSIVTSLPIMLVAAQLMLGWRELHVPRWLAARRLPRGKLRAVVERLTPLLRRAERLTRPRLPALVAPLGERLAGAVCLVVGIVLFIPIPFGNTLPGISIGLLGLGLMERDGGLVALFFVGAVFSVLVGAAVLMGLFGVGAAAVRATLGG